MKVWIRTEHSCLQTKCTETLSEDKEGSFDISGAKWTSACHGTISFAYGGEKLLWF